MPPLQSALEIDPGDPKALGLLALAEETRANNGGSTDAGETLRAAEAAAKAALWRDPGEPHARLAMIDIRAGSLDWSQMEDRLEALRATAPANVHVLGSLTSFLQAAGRTSRSWLYNEQAAAIAPARRGSPFGCGIFVLARHANHGWRVCIRSLQKPR